MKSTITILGSLCLLGSVAAAPLPANAAVQGHVPDFLAPVTVPINADIDKRQDSDPIDVDVDADASGPDGNVPGTKRHRRQLPVSSNLPISALTGELGALPELFKNLPSLSNLPIAPRQLARVARAAPLDAGEGQTSTPSLPQEIQGDLGDLFKLDISGTAAENVGPRTLVHGAAHLPKVPTHQAPQQEVDSGPLPQEIKNDLDQLLNLGIAPHAGPVRARQLPGGLPGLSSIGALNPIKNSGIGSVAGTLDKTLGNVAGPLKDGGMNNLPETLTKTLNGVHVNGA